MSCDNRWHKAGELAWKRLKQFLFYTYKLDTNEIMKEADCDWESDDVIEYVIMRI